MVNWTYRKKEMASLESFKTGVIGFIYIITLESGVMYIGRKQLRHKRKLKPLKGKKRKRVVIKESDWKTYTGSSQKFNNLQKDSPVKERKILKLCTSKRDMSYYETKYQFKHNVLENTMYANENILGKFFKRRS